MALPQTTHDLPLLVVSPNASSERRVTPSWTVAHLKARLEPITGIPASAQRLALRVGSQDPVAIAAPDEETARLSAFPLQAYAELHVSCTPRLPLSLLQSPRFLPPADPNSGLRRRMEWCHMCGAAVQSASPHAQALEPLRLARHPAVVPCHPFLAAASHSPVSPLPVRTLFFASLPTAPPWVSALLCALSGPAIQARVSLAPLNSRRCGIGLSASRRDARRATRAGVFSRLDSNDPQSPKSSVEHVYPNRRHLPRCRSPSLV